MKSIVSQRRSHIRSIAGGLLAVFAATAFGVLMAAPPLAVQAPLAVNFAPIATTATAIPDGTGSFEAYHTDPSISFGNIAVGGTGSGGQQGIYLFRAVPQPPPIKVADLNTAIPDGSGLFTALVPTPPPISENSVAFFGAGGGGQQGIYLYTDVAGPIPPPIKIADLNTPVPGGTGNFVEFSTAPSVWLSKVVLIGTGTGGQHGIYMVDSALPIPPPIVPLVDTATEIPDGFGNFTGFVPPNPILPMPPPIHGSIVAFFGAGIDGQQGIYLVDSAMPNPPPIVPVVNNNTAIPGGLVGTFSSFERLALENSDVAFVGGGSVVDGSSADLILWKGVYTAIGGELAVVADYATSIPGGAGQFTDFGAVAIDPGTVVFVGYGTGGQKGLYTNFAGALAKVIAVGDTLGGKTVADVGFGPFGFSDGQVVFRTTFTDDTQAVFLGTFCTDLQFAGFHAPIGGADESGGSVAEPVRTFKLKSTIPIKMTLILCDGTPVTDGVHTVHVIKWTSAVDSDPAVDATPTDAATSGNQFRLTDSATGGWHFNLDTQAAGLTRGTWQIVVTLADGRTHTAFISLK